MSAEYDFDDVIANDGRNNRAIIEVKMASFSRKNDVECYFTPDGTFKIKTNANGNVYSKTIPGLTKDHVEMPAEISKSNGHFKVILKKKKVFSIKELFFGNDERGLSCSLI